MPQMIPDARTVLAVRWLLAVIFRLWAIKYLVEWVPTLKDQYDRTIRITPSGASDPRPDLALLEAILLSTFPIAVALIFVLLASRLSRLVSPCPPGSKVPPQSTAFAHRARSTGWWWITIALRLWSLMLCAPILRTLEYFSEQVASTFMQILNLGNAPDAFGRSISDQIWYVASTDVASRWTWLAAAIAIWLLAPRLARLVTRAKPDACVSCGYLATSPTCPECGTQLTADLSTASASPLPPHQPPAASA